MRPSTARTRLLEAMIDAIWERSYGTVPVDAICERADVRKGSFYHFFKSKTALVVAALDHLWETRSRPAYDEIFSPTRPPLARFERLLEHWYQRAIACQREKGHVLGCPYFNVGAETASVEPEVAAKVRDILNRYQAYLESALHEANARGDIAVSDPAETAACLFSMVEGCSTQARIHDDPERVRQLASGFSSLIGVNLQPDFGPALARA